MLTRRSLLKGCAALPLAAAAPKLAAADMRLGSASLTTVSDGALTLPSDFFFEPIPEHELAPVLKELGLSGNQLMQHCNLTLYRDERNSVLFDAGAGPDFMPTAGMVTESLAAIGLSPEDITHVVFTHAHPDHIWGVLNDFDDLVFFNATYMIGRKEWDYWWDPSTANTIGEARAAFAVGARRRIERIEDTVELFEGGQEILPGISAFSTPGHTPGHMAFEIRNGGKSVMVVGDAISNPHVAFRMPGWPSGADQDQDAAIATRLMLFDRLAHEDMHLVGFHLPGGGLGQVDRKGDGYVFVAAED